MILLEIFWNLPRANCAVFVVPLFGTEKCYRDAIRIVISKVNGVASPPSRRKWKREDLEQG